MTPVYYSTVIPLDIWKNYFLKNVSGTQELGRLQCVCKTFFTLCRKNRYWNPLLPLSCRQWHGKNTALQAYFMLHVIASAHKVMNKLEAKLKISADNLHRLHRDRFFFFHADRYDALEKVDRRNYQMTRREINDQEKHLHTLTQFHQKIPLSLEQKMRKEFQNPMSYFFASYSEFLKEKAIEEDSRLYHPPSSRKFCSKFHYLETTTLALGIISLLFIAVIIFKITDSTVHLASS